MTYEHVDEVESSLSAGLRAPAPSARLQVALAAGMHPDPDDIEILVDRCASEPDFFVRDMLTWALTRHDRSSTVDRLLRELGSQNPQGRSQALHTLAKIGDPRAWPAITTDLLQDDDEAVARAAWRAAVALVPEDGEVGLAETLATQLGRGGRDARLSLSRALVALGDSALPILARARAHLDEGVRTHAIATERLMQHPDEGFDAAIAEARRVVVLLGAPLVEGVGGC